MCGFSVTVAGSVIDTYGWVKTRPEGNEPGSHTFLNSNINEDINKYIQAKTRPVFVHFATPANKRVTV